MSFWTACFLRKTRWEHLVDPRFRQEHLPGFPVNQIHLVEIAKGW